MARTLSELRHRRLPLETFCDLLMQALLPAGFDDDVALLAVRLPDDGPPPAGPPDGGPPPAG